MIFILGFILKFLIGIVILHVVMTQQELNFNPLGKLVAKVTDPVYLNTFKINKKRSNELAPLFIAVLTACYALVASITYGSYVNGFYFAIEDVIRFLFIFYVVSILVGSTINRFGSSSYSTFFYRIALPWIKFTRGVVNLPGNGIIFPAVLLISVVFIALITALHLGFSFLLSGNIVPLISAKQSLILLISVYIELLGLFTWLVIIRALMSWVSPDPRNPVVQFVIALTEPIMEPLRRVVPSLGVMDISPIVLLIFIYFLRVMLVRLISLIQMSVL